MSKSFLVTWQIDIDVEESGTPGKDLFVEAALRALSIHRDPESIATVFDVRDNATGMVRRVDIQTEEGA
jgi:hypothetical protein